MAMSNNIKYQYARPGGESDEDENSEDDYYVTDNTSKEPENSNQYIYSLRTFDSIKKQCIALGIYKEKVPSSSPKYESIPEIPDIDKELLQIQLQNLIAVWNTKKSAETTLSKVKDKCNLLLNEYFNGSQNPFSMNLFLAVRSPEFFSSKSLGTNALAPQIFIAFKNWISKNGKKKIEEKYLNHNIQTISFEIATKQKSYSLMKTIFEVYNLDKFSDKSLFYKSINEFVSVGKYKEACQIACFLKLWDQFDINLFLIPCILQDKYVNADEYLNNSPIAQKDTLAFFDSFITKDYSGINNLNSYIANKNITDVCYNKLNKKSLNKYIQKLIDLYNIDFTHCPNSRRMQKIGTIQAFFIKKFTEDEPLSQDAFEEMLDLATECDSYLEEEVMDLLVQYNDIENSAKFAIKKKIDAEKIPSCVKDKIKLIDPLAYQNFNIIESKIEYENWENEDWDEPSTSSNTTANKEKKQDISLSNSNNDCKDFQMTENYTNKEIQGQDNLSKNDDLYYSFLSLNSINMISTPEDLDNLFFKFNSAINSSLTGTIFVGFDAEWLSYFCNKKKHFVSIIQIAYGNDVFIIDIFNLRKDLNHKMWNDMIKEFFSNKKIIKLSYGITSDLHMLEKTIPQWSSLKDKFLSILDLSTLSKMLDKQSNFYPFASIGGGLGALVGACLGKPLYKGEQISHWEKRPLRPEQLKYAAYDATCLLETYEFMNQRSNELGINFEKIVDEILKPKPKPEKKSVKK